MSRFVRNSDGATAIEFGLLAIPFLMALFAILETGISMAVQQMLVNATDDVARQIRTGQITSTNQTALKNLICDRIELLVSDGCPGLRVDLRSYASFQAAADQNVRVTNNNVALLDNNGNSLPLAAQIGGPKSKQTLRAYYFWPLLTKMLESSMSTGGTGKRVLSASQTWQNEDY
ncbi:MAG: pilus assembly protein [Rhizobiaceae bacterium]|nr:pilus assembly protein [Rhizobiaceae bacterium]